MRLSAAATVLAVLTAHEAFAFQAASTVIRSNSGRISSFASSSSSSSQKRTSSSALSVSSISSSAPPEEQQQLEQETKTTTMPELDSDGIYALTNPQEHAALMEFAHDKIVVLKCFAPWCRACKGLAPKFLKLKAETANDLPIVWASLSIQHNKAFVQSLGVLALPTIQFYVGGKLLDTFPCGPSKVPILKRKLTALIQDYIDATGTLQANAMERAAVAAEEAAAKVKAAAAAKEAKKQAAQAAQQQQQSSSYYKEDTSATAITAEQRQMLQKIPYFASLSLADFDQVVSQAVSLTFQPGSVIVKEGKPGRTFYVIVEGDGDVEILQQFGATGDVLVAGYLGTVINRLGPGDWFGERALLTGEPRAASLRVATEPVRILAFDQDVFPASCVLSGQSKNTAAATQQLDSVNDKYGIDFLSNSILDKQLKESSTASQVRGSVNTPEPLVSDDIDISSSSEEEGDEILLDAEGVTTSMDSSTKGQVKDDALIAAMPPPPQGVDVSIAADDAIFTLLTRFQMIRHVSTCFKYIEDNRAVWGDAGTRTRRNMLIQRLSPHQRAEFTETFQLIDVNHDGCIELAELKRVMDSIGDVKSEKELRSVLEQQQQPQQPEVNGKSQQDTSSVESSSSSPVMTFEDYMGLMAEAEFYHLFRDIFAALDEKHSGYVKARDLDRVLCGVRDLISDDQKSIIDVEDKDMLIDYEQFSRMLLGTTLL